jgi:hypothetical protein
VGWKKQRRYAFTCEYTFPMWLLAASLFEISLRQDIKIPLLPSTTGRVGAVDPVRDAGEVGC